MYPLRVTHIADAGDDYYWISIEDHGINSRNREVRQAVKNAFATLRKAINAHRLLPEYAERYQTDTRYSVKGNCWCLHRQLLVTFASSFQLSAPLETLLWEAQMRSEQYSYRFQEPHSVSTTSVENALRFFELPQTATQEDLKKQYRQLAMRYHPDTGGDEATFKRLQYAHAILKTHIR